MTPKEFNDFITKQVELGNTSWGTLSIEYAKAVGNVEQTKKNKVEIEIVDPGTENICVGCE